MNDLYVQENKKYLTEYFDDTFINFFARIQFHFLILTNSSLFREDLLSRKMVRSLKSMADFSYIKMLKSERLRTDQSYHTKKRVIIRDLFAIK